LKPILGLLISSYDRLVTVMNWAGAVLICLLMMLIIGDVGGRTFFNSPIAGTPELAKISIVGILYLGITKTLKVGRHVRGTMLADRLPANYAAGLDILANVCGFILFALLCYSSWHLTWIAWRIGEYEGEGALRVPTYPLRTLILFTSIFMSIQFALNIGQSIVRLSNRAKRGS
jgi:TRAP-type C4-dicarboxylate transport system permease small subunit